MSQPPTAAPQVTLTIDGREVTVPKGTVVWQAAHQMGIEVPIYCYHPKMPPLGACRMCFVEIEKVPKPPQTACTTECAEGMVVHTDTELVKKARRGTLEFLLINHPLDCPICDKGGECDLQDFTLRYGPGTSRFDVKKRHFPKPIPVSDNILLDRERCIACQRCVRFTQEIAQEPGLIMLNRGFRTEVGVDPNAPFDSIFSGNVVEMCPVGALTAKSYRFMTRPWELRRTASVCSGCAVGCNVRVDVRVDRVLRLTGRTNDEVDDGWLCDRGRWGHAAVNDPQRLRVPLVRKNGTLQEAGWDEALDVAATRLGEIARRAGPAAVGGIGSTHVTNEESYLFQRVLRAGLKTNNVDHRHGVFPPAALGDPGLERPGHGLGDPGLERPRHGLGDPGLERPGHGLGDPGLERPGHGLGDPGLERPGHGLGDPGLEKPGHGLQRVGMPWAYTGSIAGLDGATAIVLLGADPYQRQPVLDLRIKKALRAGAQLTVITAEPTRIDRLAHRVLRCKPGSEAAIVRSLAQVVLTERRWRGAFAESHAAHLPEYAARLAYSTPERLAEALGIAADDLRGLARELAAADGAAILYDEQTTRVSGNATLAADALDFALLTDHVTRPNSGVGPLWGDMNALGARDMGVLPDVGPGYRPVGAPGLDYDAMLGGGVRALWVMGANPARHMAQPADLGKLDFLVVQEMTLTATAEQAHVVLPALSYAEKIGTVTNLERRVQAIRRAMPPLPGARADWEILRAVANRLGLAWGYRSPADVLTEIAATVPLYAGMTREALGDAGRQWSFAGIPLEREIA